MESLLQSEVFRKRVRDTSPTQPDWSLFLVCRMFGSQKCSHHVCWHVGSEQLEDYCSDNLRVAS